MLYSVIVIVVLMILSVVYIFRELVKIIMRQSNYIMARDSERIYQLSKDTVIDKKIKEKNEADRRQYEEVNRVYDMAFTRGEIDEQSFKILTAAEDK